ncbi:3-beta hydroxysteroid dehydrogenase isomerase family [Mycena venus]|uniref:3-beta hydroxysteroid dehydrogenase isomerase family n=1 Tax=Mycena venus TaxID=2733690 RepID=A0A8H7D541_9AGAR|nr:3-beta hydroxysteroid dehydrogenase isomerase family [Mycena venus]
MLATRYLFFLISKILDRSLSLCNNCNSTFLHSPLLPCATRSAQILHILRTNDWKCDDATDIRTIISDGPEEIARYDRELNRLRGLYEKVLAGRDNLQKFYSHCTGIVEAPIRRLPNEVLVQIFSLCTEPKEWYTEKTYDEDAMKQELWGVAGGHLITLSLVSHHWRRVVLGTPSLWSTIELDLRCWTGTVAADDSYHCYLRDTMVERLKVALERGEQTPLTIRVNGMGECDPSALYALAGHSERWRSATFLMGQDMLQYLSSVEGRLPLLETLSISEPRGAPETFADTIRYFSQAPCLRTVEFHGGPAVLTGLPLEQLDYCRFFTLDAQSVDSLFRQMARLTRSAEVEVQVDLEAVGFQDARPLVLPPVVSNINEFVLQSVGNKDDEFRQVLGAIFDALTLPNIEGLGFFSREDLGNPLYWPQREAHALFVRSASRRTLQSLCLRDVVVTASELLQCLADLSSLEYLYISDHPALVGGSRPHHLITSALLQKLSPCTDRPTDCLVPNLRDFTFRTLGRFTDDSFLDFVGERSLRVGFVGPFECTLLWLPGYARGLKPDTTSCLDNQLVKKGDTVFACREYDPSTEQS